MSIIQTTDINMPSDPATLKQIQDCMFEVSASKTRIEGEKSLIKEAIADLSEKTGVNKKYLNKIANLYHKQNRQEVEAEAESTVELYDRIFPQDQQSI